MPEDYMLKEAIEAVRQGQKVRARDLLTRLLRADQSNPTYWLWMSSVVETSREQIYCLQTVLGLEPKNDAARRGLILVGALPPNQGVSPQPLVRRKWQVAAQPEPPQGIKALWANPVVRISFLAVMGLVVVGLILAGIFGLGGGKKPAQVASRPTRTPGPAATFTSTPTYIASTLVVEKATPVPVETGPTPLWMLLEATYTPTPIYVNTPHAISEDFRIGQRAFGRGDWATALRHFKNASLVDPSAADIQYLIGEAQRMMNDPRAALESYNAALKVNPSFAPAYLGRALATRSLDHNADISEDLAKAVELDPNYGEARLQRVAYVMQSGDLEAARGDLEAAELLMPASPLLAYFQAEYALQSGDREDALEYARKAYDLDRTYLPAYRLLGEMALANGEFATAKETLEIYLQYAETDARGWMALGQAYMEFTGPEQAYSDLVRSVLKKDVDAALQAFEHAQALDEELPGVYLYRAATYLAQGEGQDAVNDLMKARRLDTNSFAINLGLGRALLVAGRLDDAINQINSCEKLTQDDTQLAAVYYWRALVTEMHDRAIAAVEDWQALLALPEEAVPAEWRHTAEAHLAALTPSPTATRTPEPSSTSTPSPTLTKRASVTPTPTKRASITPTLVKSVTPAFTP
jgi:tetratricopeptide (TPR) repeat protein